MVCLGYEDNAKVRFPCSCRIDKNGACLFLEKITSKELVQIYKSIYSHAHRQGQTKYDKDLNSFLLGTYVCRNELVKSGKTCRDIAKARHC